MPEKAHTETDGHYVKYRDQNRFRGSARYSDKKLPNQASRLGNDSKPDFNANSSKISNRNHTNQPTNLSKANSGSYGRAINQSSEAGVEPRRSSGDFLFNLERVLPAPLRERPVSSSGSLQEFYSDPENKSKSMPMSPSVISSPENDSNYRSQGQIGNDRQLAGGDFNLNRSIDYPNHNREQYRFENSQIGLLDREERLRRSGRYKKSGGGLFRSGSLRSLKKLKSLFQSNSSKNHQSSPDRNVQNPRPYPIQTPNGYPSYPAGPSSALNLAPGILSGHPRHPPREGYEPLEAPNWERGKFEGARNGNDGFQHRNGSVMDHRSSTYFNGEDSGLETPNSDDVLINGGHSILPREPQVTPGLGGIVNHGNTCYINSVIQCLSNTDALAHYFVSDKFAMDLNNKDQAQAKNARKFGSNGELTRWLAQFLKDLWFDRYRSAMSRDFKALIGRYSIDYRSGCQQDAQEFLMWILDKVHEDLNTATKRRYKTSIKGKDVGDPDEIAEKTLTQHRRSHWSYINALFEAQFRSCVTCPACGREKLNFDPYMCVSVPVPQSTTKPLFVTMVYQNRLPRQLCLGLNADVTATMREVKNCLAQEAKVSLDQLVLCEISNQGFLGSFSDMLDIAALGAGKMIHAIETPSPRSPTPESKPELIILAQNLVGWGPGAVRYGGPFALKVAREISYEDLCRALLEAIRPLLRYDVVSMRDILSGAFNIRVADEYSPNLYLEKDVLMPLYMEHIDRTLSRIRGGRNSGPIHLKVMLEWTQESRHRYMNPVEEKPLEHMSAAELHSEMKAGTSYSLERCLEDYIKPEYLEWTCRFCKRYQHRARKSIMFYSLPDVLIVHLKRFKQLPNGQQVKLDPEVSFPIRGLDLSRFTYQERTPGTLRRNTPQSRSLNGLWRKKGNGKHLGVPPATLGGSREWLNGNSDTTAPLFVDTGPHQGVYDLFSIINHHGESMNSGHYTTFARNPVDGIWRHFDDTHVTKVDENRLVTNGAYILFYERRDLSPAESRISTESGYAEHWFYGLAASSHHANSMLAANGWNSQLQETLGSKSQPNSRPVSRPTTPVDFRSPSRATVENGELAREMEKRRDEEGHDPSNKAGRLTATHQHPSIFEERRQETNEIVLDSKNSRADQNRNPHEPQSVQAPILLTQKVPAPGGSTYFSENRNARQREERQFAIPPPPKHQNLPADRSQREEKRPERGDTAGQWVTAGGSQRAENWFETPPAAASSTAGSNSPIKKGFPPDTQYATVLKKSQKTGFGESERVTYANSIWDKSESERKRAQTRSAIETDL